MRIYYIDDDRILLKDDNSKINISDKITIKYVANYYTLPLSYNTNHVINHIQTEFVGIIDAYRSNNYDGITGIYVKPLYVFLNDKWNRIINYKYTYQNYFLYPHLLMLPGKEYHFYPIYSLDTVTIFDLVTLEDISDTIELEDQMYKTNMLYY
jgi:hypothetical protein